MTKDKLLIVLPYGMCLRQIVLNETLWNYLINNYQVDVMSSLEISEEVQGINKVIKTEQTNFFNKILRRISAKSATSLKASMMVNFFLDNNIGENFALRWRWFGDQARNIVVMSGLVNIKIIGSIIKNFLKFLVQIYPVFFLSKNKYKLVIITHVSDVDCSMMAIGANQLSLPLISITLGLDNYAHGPLIYKPDLMLLWGEEQLKEFNQYNVSHDKEFSKTKCYKIGSLIHDNYLQVHETEKIDYLSKNFSLDPDQKFILVAVMLEEVLPKQTALCEILIDFLEEKNLQHKLVIRKLPLSDNNLWQQFYEKYPDRVIIQEPRSASFDKRQGSIKFDLDSSNRDVSEFVQTLSRSDLVLGLYPSTLLLDAMLFNKQTAVALFDWSDDKAHGGHPQEKFYLAKKYTHYHRRHYNFLYSKKMLHSFMADVLIKGIKFPEERREIFLEITGDSIDGNSGSKAVNAIDNFLGNY